MKKPTAADIVAALRSEDPAEREAMAVRVAEKRPRGRPFKWTEPYARLFCLEIFYTMLATTKNNRAEARRLTVQWFRDRSIVVTEKQVLSAYDNYRPPNVTTVAEWKAWSDNIIKTNNSPPPNVTTMADWKALSNTIAPYFDKQK